MGGLGSGRRGGGPLVEDGLVLSISALRRDGFLRPGRASGRLTWRTAHSKRVLADIGFERWLGEEEGTLRVHYTLVVAGEKTCLDYTIRLVPTPQPLGGRRWWFICPVTGTRCAKLYMPPGSTKFAARRAYRRLAYRSQRATPFDRACERAWDLRHRLGAEGGIGDWIRKPKWMRWRTFERKLAHVLEAEDRATALLPFGHLPPSDPSPKIS